MTPPLRNPSSTGLAADCHIAAVLPALDEEDALRVVLGELPRDLIRTVIVVDNGSTDRTAEVARSLGATVVREPRRGYGRACLAGLRALPPESEIVVFLDADASDFPADARLLVEPILRGEADFVLGSRALGPREAGALLWHQERANRVFTSLIRLLYGHQYTDLGPFRAIRRESLDRLEMRATGFGWTVEMQVKALRRGLRVREVPVRYRKRIGRSKISGNWRASIAAGCKIVWTTLRLYFHS